MPFEEIKSENVTRITNSLKTSPYVATGSNKLVVGSFQKSTKSQTFSRGFNKVDAYFSYVGGLVGTIIGLFFIMGPYTEKAFEVSLAKKIIVDNEKEELSSRSFNLGYFLLGFIKKGLEFFSFNLSW